MASSDDIIKYINKLDKKSRKYKLIYSMNDSNLSFTYITHAIKQQQRTENLF